MCHYGVHEVLTVHADNWDRDATPMTKNNFGVWEVTLPPKDGQPAITHDSKIKVSNRSCVEVIIAKPSGIDIARGPQ